MNKPLGKGKVFVLREKSRSFDVTRPSTSVTMQNVRSGKIEGETTPRVLNVDVHRRARADHQRSNGRIQRLMKGVFTLFQADLRRFVAEGEKKFSQSVFFRWNSMKILHRFFQSAEQFVGSIDQISILLKIGRVRLVRRRRSCFLTGTEAILFSNCSSSPKVKSCVSDMTCR